MHILNNLRNERRQECANILYDHTITWNGYHTVANGYYTSGTSPHPSRYCSYRLPSGGAQLRVQGHHLCWPLSRSGRRQDAPIRLAMALWPRPGRPAGRRRYRSPLSAARAVGRAAPRPAQTPPAPAARRTYSQHAAKRTVPQG